MLTYHPNTGAATPHRSGDRSVVLNVEPPPAPGLLGSSSSCLIPLLYTDHIFSALLGLCHWHFPSRCLLDHSSPQWHNLKLVFCQSFWRWKGKALPRKTKSCYSLLPSCWKMHQSKFDCHKQVVQFGRACQLSLVKMSSQWSYQYVTRLCKSIVKTVLFSTCQKYSAKCMLLCKCAILHILCLQSNSY